MNQPQTQINAIEGLDRKIVLGIVAVATFAWQFVNPCTSLPVLNLKLTPTALYDPSWFLLFTLWVVFTMLEVVFRLRKTPAAWIAVGADVSIILLILLQLFFCGPVAKGG